MWTRAEQEALERVTEAEYALEHARNELHRVMRREASRERSERGKSTEETRDQAALAECRDTRPGPARVLACLSHRLACALRLRRWRSLHSDY
jgi:hypothetical protein